MFAGEGGRVMDEDGLNGCGGGDCGYGKAGFERIEWRFIGACALREDEDAGAVAEVVLHGSDDLMAAIVGHEAEGLRYVVEKGVSSQFGFEDADGIGETGDEHDGVEQSGVIGEVYARFGMWDFFETLILETADAQSAGGEAEEADRSEDHWFKKAAVAGGGICAG